MISVIIPAAGNDPERQLNFKETLHCLEQQSYPDWELIIVEQSLDGNFYHAGISCDRYVPVRDPESSVFNLSWLRNVGARQAKGDRLVFMDADMVFAADYLQRVADFEGDPFFRGMEFVVESNSVQKAAYLQSRDLAGLLAEIEFFFKAEQTNMILCCERSWYWNTFGGLIENFYAWGWEDLEGIYRITKILQKPSSKLHYLKGARVAHLYHQNRDLSVYDPGKELYYTCQKMDHRRMLKGLQMIGVGNPDNPSLLPDGFWSPGLKVLS